MRVMIALLFVMGLMAPVKADGTLEQGTHATGSCQSLVVHSVKVTDCYSDLLIGVHANGTTSFTVKANVPAGLLILAFLSKGGTGPNFQTIPVYSVGGDLNGGSFMFPAIGECTYSSIKPRQPNTIKCSAHTDTSTYSFTFVTDGINDARSTYERQR